ncbi:MAG: restriction endonuclease subunit S [Nostocales cyanobacterium ELA583]|jgi:type I restriction enzyme S subunit
MENKLQLSTLCEAIVDCEHKTAPIQPWGIPSIRTTNIKNGRIDFKNANRVSEEVYKQWTARLEPKPGDLILAREAPVGDVGIIPPNQKACLGQRTVLIRTNQEKLDSRYLLYLLLTPQMRYKMMSKSEGSTVSHLNMSDIRNLEIPKLPPLSEQKAIAHILSSLDDKIELNQQINETLEAMARAIFKSWFVDFDPVRAKMEGRQPAGIDTATADLFPDEFEESSLGLIPKGWRIGNLKDCCQKIENGGTPKRNIPTYWTPKEVPWLTSGEVRQKIVIFTESFISKLGLTNSSAKLWSSGTTVVALYGATAGQVCFLAEEMCTNQACCGLTPLANMKYFIYLKLSSSIELLESQARGSAQQNLSQEIVAKFPTVIPNDPILMSFERIAHPLFYQWIANLNQCQNLATIRNTLLPKLMSGEIRVKEAEKIIEKLT